MPNYLAEQRQNGTRINFVFKASNDEDAREKMNKDRQYGLTTYRIYEVRVVDYPESPLNYP